MECVLGKAGRAQTVTPRLPMQVLMDVGPGHQPLAEPSSPEAAKRGPGAYDLEDYDTMGRTGLAFDFGRWACPLCACACCLCAPF